MKNKLQNIINSYDNFKKFKINLSRNKDLKFLRDEIIQTTIFLNGHNPHLNERIYCIINDIKERKCCKLCNNFVKYGRGLAGYREFCSKKCIGLFNRDKHSKSLKVTYEQRGDEIKAKRKKTLNLKYGVDNPMQNINIQQKVKNTLKERTGYEFALQNPKSHMKFKETCLEKYGVENYSQTEEYKNKFKETCLERFGVDSPLKNKEIRNKIKDTLYERYGVYNAGLIHTSSYSKTSQELFWKIFNKLPNELKIKTYFKELNKEFDIFYGPKKQYLYDFVISNIKFCLEYNGDYWHANPSIYEKSFEMHGTKAEDIWKRDKFKIEKLKDRGYKVFIIWESDYFDNKDKIIDEIIIKIMERLEDIRSEVEETNNRLDLQTA